jgi:hypothetical protein
MKRMGACLTIAALALVIVTLTGATEGVQAAKHKQVHLARHRAPRRICYVTRPTHGARRVCRFVGGYSRLTIRDIWGPAGMPPAPTDFGPHFDFPPASLNDGLTEAPYPGW